VRGSFLQKYCECSGTFVNLIPNDEISSLVRALDSFTKHIKMIRLKKEIEWIIHLNPELKIVQNSS
jgi:hypothetical protein